MSEIPSSASNQGQNSTHAGSITLPDFNLSLHLHVYVTAAPALQAALDRIAEALKPVQGEYVSSGSEIVYHGLNEEQVEELVRKDVIPPVMAGLDPAQKSDGFEFKGVLVPRPDWIRVPGYRDLRYYQEGEKLFVKYAGSGALETSWKQMVEFSKLPIEECKKARDKLLEELKMAGNTASATAVNCFVTAIQKGHVVPPGSIQVSSEKTPETKPKKGVNVHWTDIPKHPHLRYREEDGKLILKYAGSVVETTWQQVENTARLDQKYWKHEIEKMLGARQASNRRAAVSLFLKLVEKGEVSRVTISQFQAEEGTGVSA